MTPAPTEPEYLRRDVRIRTLIDGESMVVEVLRFHIAPWKSWFAIDLGRPQFLFQEGDECFVGCVTKDRAMLLEALVRRGVS